MNILLQALTGDIEGNDITELIYMIADMSPREREMQHPRPLI